MAAAGFALFGAARLGAVRHERVAGPGVFPAGRLPAPRGGAVAEGLCFAMVAALPLVGMAVHEFRPDHAAALFTAAGVMVLLSKPFVYGGRERQLAAGALFAAAHAGQAAGLPADAGAGGRGAGHGDGGATGRRRAAAPGPPPSPWPGGRSSRPSYSCRCPTTSMTAATSSPTSTTRCSGTSGTATRSRGRSLYQLRYYLDGEGGRIMLGRAGRLLALLLVRRRRVGLLRPAAGATHARTAACSRCCSWRTLSPRSTRSSRNFSAWRSTPCSCSSPSSFWVGCWSPSGCARDRGRGGRD